MTINITSPVTGSAQTGFTSPTYTVATDQAPSNNSKQVVVTALGGTQTGAIASSVNSPFTTTLFKPAVFRVPGVPNPSNGVIYNIANNIWRVLTRKGAIPAVNQSPRIAVFDTSITLPAGTQEYSPAEIKAGLAMHIGVLNQISASLGESVQNGTL